MQLRSSEFLYPRAVSLLAACAFFACESPPPGDEGNAGGDKGEEAQGGENANEGGQAAGAGGAPASQSGGRAGGSGGLSSVSGGIGGTSATGGSSGASVAGKGGSSTGGSGAGGAAMGTGGRNQGGATGGSPGTGGAPADTSGVGTGRTSALKYVTVTGAGPLPNVANGSTADCNGTGSVNAQPCLQAAITAATAAGKPLLIPKSAAHYRIDAPLRVTTSLIGINGMPTIKQTNTSGGSAGHVLTVPKDVTAWITGLRLVGTHPAGGGGNGEHAHNISLTGVNGVTIKGNILEHAQGDGVYGTGNSRNVLIINNTVTNPRRCGVALIYVDTWAIMDNVFDKQINYVSAIDWEPNLDPDTTNNVEVGYNKFIMNNRTKGQYGSDGRAVSAWQNTKVTKPGSGLFMHHNYGTFGVGFWMTTSSYKGGNGDWMNVVMEKNVEGPTPAL